MICRTCADVADTGHGTHCADPGCACGHRPSTAERLAADFLKAIAAPNAHRMIVLDAPETPPDLFAWLRNYPSKDHS